MLNESVDEAMGGRPARANLHMRGLLLLSVLVCHHVAISAAQGQPSQVAPTASWKDVIDQLKAVARTQRIGIKEFPVHAQQEAAAEEDAAQPGSPAPDAAATEQSELALPALPDWSTDYDASSTDDEDLPSMAAVLEHADEEEPAPAVGQPDVNTNVQDMEQPLEADATSSAKPQGQAAAAAGGGSDGGAASPPAGGGSATDRKDAVPAGGEGGSGSSSSSSSNLGSSAPQPAVAAPAEPDKHRAKVQWQRKNQNNNGLGLMRRNKKQQQQASPQEQAPQQQQQASPQQQPLPQPADEAREAAKADQRLASQKLPTRAPLHASPPPTLAASAAVDVDAAQLQVPQSFLGISHEWTQVEELDASPGYKAAIKLLTSHGSGPFIVRVGGGSTDKLREPAPGSTLEALARVAREAGVRYILGLNFEAGELALTQAQLRAAQAALPEDAVLTYELGNEPNFYTSKRNMTALDYSRCCFTTEWTDFARNLSCPCGNASCCMDGMFAGPAWGHINVYPSTIKWFLDNAARSVNLVTVHWYKATRETPVTAASLLDEAPLRREMDNLRQLVQVSNSFGKPLRVAEMNTISNSGRLGVSNAFAAALWTLDAAFEVAAAGAVGINLHQGAGQNLYTAIVRREDRGGLKPAVLRPPFYGMLLFQQAVGGGSVLLGKSEVSGDVAHVKLWPLQDAASRELRFVLVNKHASQAATQVVRLAGAAAGRDAFHAVAHLTRLVAQGEAPLEATDGITLGGHYWAAGCERRGRDQTLLLEADGGPDDGPLVWSVYLPPGSATLMRIKPRAAVAV